MDTQHSCEHHYQASVTDDNARFEFDCMRIDTKHNLAYIKSKFETHGDLILSRWSKKSHEKRKITLVTAAPSCFISETHLASMRLELRNLVNIGNTQIWCSEKVKEIC
jgi:hypothetical protein